MLLAVSLAGCDLFGPSGPGVLNATLTSSGELGAVVLEVTGLSITGFAAQGDARVYGARLSEVDGLHRVVLISPTGGPMQFGIEVDDLGADPPLVTVLTAVNTKNFTTAATGIEVRVER